MPTLLGLQEIGILYSIFGGCQDVRTVGQNVIIRYMNISIKSTNIELTPAIKDYTEKRIGTIKKYTGEATTASVEVGKTTGHHKHGDIFRAEVNITTALGKQFRAVSEKSDLYEAIDDVRNEIVREINSARGKSEAMWKKGARKFKNMLRGFRN